MLNRRNKLLISAVIIVAAGGLLVTFFLGGFDKRTAKETDTQSPLDPALLDVQLCGPISLHTAARMLGIQINRRQLLEVCNPSAAGVSMAALADAAHKFGLDAKGFKMTWEKLIELDSSAVLYVNTNHFVAVSPSQYASDKFPDRIRVFDTVEAPKWWSREKLESSWSGETLVISEGSKRKRIRGPRVRFDSLIYDLGDVRVPQNEKFNLSLQFTNIGNETLNIGNIKTSCGCTKVSAPPKALELGKRGTVDVAVDLDEIRGAFSHTVAVETNDKLTPLTEVVITGRTYNTQITTQRELLLNAIPRASHTSKSVVLKDPGDGSLKDSITAVSVLPKSLSSENDPIYIKSVVGSFDPNRHPLLQAKADDVVVDVEVAVSESAPVGDFDGILEITTKVPGSEHIQIPIRGVVISNIAARPPALFYSDDKGEPISKSVTIASRTGRVIDLQTISVPDNLPLKVEKQNGEDKAIVLTATYSPSKREANTITGDIVCSFADETVLRIPVIIHSQQPD